jgi:hypothetical protein
MLVFNWFSFTTRLVIEFTSNVSTSASAHTADMVKAYLQTELPAMWHELPEAIHSKFAAKRIPYPRLTKGQDIGSSMSVMTSLSELGSIDPRTGVLTNQWDEPPNLKSPTNIDALHSNHRARDVDLSLIPNRPVKTRPSPLTPAH